MEREAVEKVEEPDPLTLRVQQAKSQVEEGVTILKKNSSNLTLLKRHPFQRPPVSWVAFEFPYSVTKDERIFQNFTFLGVRGRGITLRVFRFPVANRAPPPFA